MVAAEQNPERNRNTLMSTTAHGLSAPTPTVSPLVLADRMLDLAKEADRAGYATTAGRLLDLALAVLDNPPAPRFKSQPVSAAADPTATLAGFGTATAMPWARLDLTNPSALVSVSMRAHHVALPLPAPAQPAVAVAAP
jgi:hypothetical protein